MVVNKNIDSIRYALKIKPATNFKAKPSLYDFLGQNSTEQALNIAKKVISSSIKLNSPQYIQRKDIFEYIIDFYKRSTISVDFGVNIGKGLNLAKRSFLTPNGDDLGKGFFSEQYRWDTYFQNLGLLIIGGHAIAKDQLLNLIDVFNDFGRIPNALSTWFLSHAQPPLESKMLFDIIKYQIFKDDTATTTNEAHLNILNQKKALKIPQQKLNSLKWTKAVVETIEQELVSEWWDFDLNKKNPRQNLHLVEKYGPYITRHTSIHFHSLLVGCEDGKDHNWINAKYGEYFLPVQLNSIIYGIITDLVWYYISIEQSEHKVNLYSKIAKQLKEQFNKLFWIEQGSWNGYFNYSLHDDTSILYGDLAAQIWPLFVGLADFKQAELVRTQLAKYYAGDIGLAATSVELRKNSSIPVAPKGHWGFQWEKNCWPPLMHVAVVGLLNYSKNKDDAFYKDAVKYMKNWTQWVEQEFERSGGIHEKGPYSSKIATKEGYYGVLRGFGWTIGVYLDFLKRLSVMGEL